MSVTTVSPTTPVALPDLDTTIGDALGDEMLLGLATTENVAKVAGQTGTLFQSHTARAWSRGGQVD